MGQPAETISIVYDQDASVQAATDRLKETTNGIAAGGGQSLPGVGDEALIFARLNASGGATVYFRKAVGTASVTAPSVEMATQVAQLVAAQIY